MLALILMSELTLVSPPAPNCAVILALTSGYLHRAKWLHLPRRQHCRAGRVLFERTTRQSLLEQRRSGCQ